MYELSKVRLYSVGPPGARYEDVVIDLSGAGTPVRDQQLMLGQPEVRRPSPASILFLENGGGKSVLIKLIFSVMLPGKRQVVGTSNTKVLEKFVDRKDVAHVVLEWMHTRTGRMLLTGKVSDWRRRGPQSGEDNLVDLWYSLRPNSVVDITTLPFAEDGHNLVATEFRSRLDDFAEEDPALELEWADKHWKWGQRLADLGLDAELFRYQRDMNAGEGEAADAFTFTTDEAFVDFLLKAVLPHGDAEDLADSIAGHAEKIAKRNDLELERAFVAEVLELLDPLAEQRSATVRADAVAAEASTELDAFVTRLIARVVHENGLLDQRKQHIGELTIAVSNAAGALRRAQDIHAALAHRTETLRLDAARSAEHAAAGVKEHAERVINGWAATRKLMDHETTAEHAAALREVVGQREDAARMALEARDTKSRALARALLVTADAAIAEAEHEDAQLEKLKEVVEGTTESWRTAVAAAAQATALAAQLNERVAGVDAEVEAAVEAGLITSVTSLYEDAVSLADRVRTDSAEIEENAGRLNALEAQVGVAQTELLQAQGKQVAARSRHENAVTVLNRAEVAAEALGREPRLIELLDTDDVMLEYDVETLLDQLAKAQADFDQQRTELRVADAADEPARLIWEETPEALLPPPHEVAHIRRLLESEGIACGTGWDYVADHSDESTRAELVRHLPHLAGGVLVNKPEHLDRAREVIAEHGYHPSGIVTVATSHSFDMVVDAAFDLSLRSTAGFVAPPNPALFDPAAAKAEQTRIANEHAARKARLAELDATYSADRALAARLSAWRAEYPSGTLAGLAEAVTSAEAALRDADQAVEHRERVLVGAVEARDAHKKLLAELRQALDLLKERSRSLTELAGKSRESDIWKRNAAQARGQVEAETTRAEEFFKHIGRLRGDVAVRQRRADDQRALAARTRDEIDNIQGDTAVNPDAPVPDQPVAVLRDVLREAQRVYDKAEVGDDQLKELQAAEVKATTARREWEDEPSVIRDIARQLLESTDGADAASRASAVAQASSRLQSADRDYRNASNKAAACGARLEQLPAPTVVLDRSLQPRDAEHGEVLVTEATETVENTGESHERRIADLEAARTALGKAEVVADAFRTIADAHRAASDDQSDIDTAGVEPFRGDVDAARSRYGELRRATAVAQKVAQDAHRALRTHAERLDQRARDSRFESLSIPARTQIPGVGLSAMADHAAEWAQQLRPRLRSLTDDLEQVDRHRSVIIERLTAIVDGALRRLRTAQRLSKLPRGLGDWTGLEFLRIGCTPVEGDLLAHQLGLVLDDAVERHKTNGKRDGLGVVLRAVRAAVPKGFKVTMLKPDAVLRAERVRISEVRDVFSGGQHLTAAIILYCTMAALRANNQGRTRHHHSGVLFLDNPIGRASAGYLLDLQRGVAAALGVQLVYTTGLFEEEALGGFPLIVRLRNDADLRAGRKYLSVHERIALHLDSLAVPNGTGVLTTTRVVLPERRRGEAD
ncbi:hypothetical protein ABZ816_39930 [Actinosynnema sp. NPDC047251]|uniref:Chromosome segregation ATPase-like protein n=1 Tax=Saccharothrix espanaensis (strain ATCC 51144 / DSM 44229 / JCM 9112 / NBRC 15066 / NRRL 15764) TaxID=1179773 RepID=K0JXB4_SACES|nr:hypothetical protein [Saccharothrix espanaensis]CCH29399.1 hypothetical protein BN6_20790 [Saccharothrix espanaensis DSM 44229]